MHHKKNKILAADRKFGDFILELEFKLPLAGAFGMVVRADVEAENFVLIPILDETKFHTVENNNSDDAPVKVILAFEQVSKTVRADDWNTLQIRCQGQQLQLTMNDTSIDDAAIKAGKGNDMATTGLIGFGSADGDGKGTRFRNIRIQKLD